MRICSHLFYQISICWIEVSGWCGSFQVLLTTLLWQLTILHLTCSFSIRLLSSPWLILIIYLFLPSISKVTAVLPKIGCSLTILLFLLIMCNLIIILLILVYFHVIIVIINPLLIILLSVLHHFTFFLFSSSFWTSFSFIFKFNDLKFIFFE